VGTVQNREFWERQSTLPGLRSVIDPNDLRGTKSAYLDQLHKAALSHYGRFRSHDRVLDFGCGSGRIARWLAPRVATVHAVDGHRAMLERARTELAAAALDNLLLCPYDGANLPFAPAAFDTVTGVWVLQHIVDEAELANVLRELARIVRHGGQALFIERVGDDSEEPWMPPGTIIRRPVEVYLRLFGAAGLPCVRTQPIWDGGAIWHRALVDRLVLSGRLPQWLFKAVARVDLFVRRRPIGEWNDHVFLCSRL
jgi:SAM-dependent methyltransferase